MSVITNPNHPTDIGPSNVIRNLVPKLNKSNGDCTTKIPKATLQNNGEQKTFPTYLSLPYIHVALSLPVKL